MDRVGRKNVHSNNCEHISGSEKISLSVDYRYCERWIRLLLVCWLCPYMASAHLDRVNVQVFWVRHGETDFNRRGLVLGQVDEVSESIKGWPDSL